MNLLIGIATYDKSGGEEQGEEVCNKLMHCFAILVCVFEIVCVMSK